MNKLALTLFVNKYYDLVFLLGVLLMALVVFAINRYLNKKQYGKFKIKKNQNLLKKSILIFILLLGLMLRLYKISSPLADWHSFRQADTASVTRLYLENGLDLLNPKYHDLSSTQSGLFNPEGFRFVEFPIFNLVHLLLVKAMPFLSFEEVGRMVSIISALTSSILLYLLGKKIINEWGGIFASGFYLLLPFNIYFTRVILPEPLSVTLGLASIYLFWLFIDSGKGIQVILSAIFMSLSVLVKPYAIFYLIPIFVIAIRKYGLINLAKKLEPYFLVVIVLLPLILWRFWINSHPEGIPFWKWTLNGDGIRFRPAFWYWIFGERIGKMILGVWGVVIFFIGALIYSKRKFIQFFLLGSLFYISIIATANVRHDYYQILIIPSICLALSNGLTNLWNYGKNKDRLIRIGLVVSIILMFIVSGFQVKEFYKINRPEILRAGKAADEILPKDAIVIAPYNGDTAFLYQTKRRGWPVVDRPIDELIEKGARYFISVDFNHYQTIDFSERFETIVKDEDFTILDLKVERSK